MSSARATEAQKAVIRYLLEHPAESIFDYYEARSPRGSWGIVRTSRRGAAGRMYYRMEDAGLLEGRREHPIVTAAGEEALDG